MSVAKKQTVLHFEYQDSDLIMWHPPERLDEYSFIEEIIAELTAGASLSEVMETPFSSADFWQTIGFGMGRFYTRRAINVDGEYFFEAKPQTSVGPILISPKLVYSREELADESRHGRISYADKYHINKTLTEKHDIPRFFTTQQGYCALKPLTDEVLILKTEQLR